MDKYPARRPIDYSKYQRPASELEAYYGLPKDVRFCTKCVISNQRPNSTQELSHTIGSKKSTIHFADDGVCDACRFAARKKVEIDWKKREDELWALCDKYRSKTGQYDCLVPGSGGKDSFYQSHILKNKFKMNPLTVTWAPHIYTEWGWKNFQSWIHAGFDNMLVTPNGRVHRLVTRLAVEELFHPFQPFIIGQKAMAPKLAKQMGIPLVFYGENESEYGNPIADTSVAHRDYSYFTQADKSKIFLGGVSLSDLYNQFGLEEGDLIPYMPANPEELRAAQVEVHYLGYYLKWHPQGAYYYAVEHGGFQPSPERTPGTYSKYNSIDDRIDDFHYFTTRVKFGIGRATYDASQEIRNEEIDRDEGVALVKKFDHEFPERFSEEIFRYLSIPAKEFPVATKMFEQPIMDREYFMRLTDRFRSPHLWKYEEGEWRLRHTVYEATPATV
ncbi:MAG: N-acetyl sugar amidotransferase [Planctomycetota bacterium]|nr:N-acetyl sugar amidotransferase [Planctomycetota bacterium]